ncbi:unnamed protein product [Ilex paraguariensis]|uniref:PhoD-like phosphatase metallophosphatase domain-containing protein n=1 Tax=Ilex paraguariensis TaxID=185542 RepID=A0ABC8U942_9AQUA
MPMSIVMSLSHKQGVMRQAIIVVREVISNHSAVTGPLFYMESWGRFPKERNRFFKLISDSKRDGVFFISGDVHFGEITRYDCATRYPLYDITSSGLTQAVEKAVPPPLRFIVRFVAWLMPTTMRQNADVDSYVSQPQTGSNETGYYSSERGKRPKLTTLEVISNHSAVTGPLFYMESWGRFPKERNRFFKLISDSKRDGVFFISGDVHFGEITRYDCATRYPLYDITSSGLTQAVEKAVPPPLRFIVRFVAWLMPTTMRVMNKSCRYKSCIYGQSNFGVIEINWDSTPVTLKFEVRDVSGLPVASVNVSLLELQGQMVDPKSAKKARGYEKHCSLELNLPGIVRYRLAILFFSALAVLLLGLLGLVYAVMSVCRQHLRKRKLD